MAMATGSVLLVVTTIRSRGLTERKPVYTKARMPSAQLPGPGQVARVSRHRSARRDPQQVANPAQEPRAPLRRPSGPRRPACRRERRSGCTGRRTASAPGRPPEHMKIFFMQKCIIIQKLGDVSTELKSVTEFVRLISQIVRSMAELCHTSQNQIEYRRRSTNLGTVSQFGEL